MKLILSTSAAILTLAAAPVLAGQPSSPGVGGQAKAFYSPGFSTAAEANGNGTLGQAANVFGNNGKGNGADPDPLGLEDDHDPNNYGGEPDTSR